jgi:hypothetical protein
MIKRKKKKSVTTRVFFFFFFENIQMDLHSGTTTCRSADITYTFHNMYMIFRVASNTAKYKYQYAAEHINSGVTSNTSLLLITRVIYKSIYLTLIKHITLTTY